MFESLSTRLQDVFTTLRGESRLTPENIEVALREIRLALLEADVNFKVVKAFVDRVRDRSMDAVADRDVLRGLSPSQEVVKIVRDEMVALFGTAEGGLRPSSARPRVILMLGLQGAGKTTTSGKLAKWLTKQGKHPMLVSTDVKRPAAIQQLNVVAEKAGVRVHDPAGQLDPVARAKGAVAEATTLGFDAVIVDTAGRLHIDDELMNELVAIKDVTAPSDLLTTIKKMGPLEQIVGMLPGMGKLKALAENKPDDKQITRIEAIINSMTPEERRKQHIINGSRRKRIARGSGTTVEEVNRLLKQFVQMQKMLKQLGGMAGLAGGGKKARRQAMQMLRNRG